MPLSGWDRMAARAPGHGTSAPAPPEDRLKEDRGLGAGYCGRNSTARTWRWHSRTRTASSGTPCAKASSISCGSACRRDPRPRSRRDASSALREGLGDPPPHLCLPLLRMGFELFEPRLNLRIHLAFWRSSGRKDCASSLARAWRRFRSLPCFMVSSDSRPSTTPNARAEHRPVIWCKHFRHPGVKAAHHRRLFLQQHLHPYSNGDVHRCRRVTR